MTPIYAPWVTLPLNRTEVVSLFRRLFVSITDDSIDQVIALYTNSLKPSISKPRYVIGNGIYDRLWTEFLTGD